VYNLVIVLLFKQHKDGLCTRAWLKSWLVGVVVRRFTSLYNPSLNMIILVVSVDDGSKSVSEFLVTWFVESSRPLVGLWKVQGHCLVCRKFKVISWFVESSRSSVGLVFSGA